MSRDRGGASWLRKITRHLFRLPLDWPAPSQPATPVWLKDRKRVARINSTRQQVPMRGSGEINYDRSPVPTSEDRASNVAHASFPRMLGRGVVLLNRWWRRMQSRYQLAIMTERELRDVGFSRQDADREIRKPFWRE